MKCYIFIMYEIPYVRYQDFFNMLTYHKMAVTFRSTDLIVHQTSTAQRRTRVVAAATHAVVEFTAWTPMSVVHPPHHQHINFWH